MNKKDLNKCRADSILRSGEDIPDFVLDFIRDMNKKVPL